MKLGRIAESQLHRAFQEAFADYAVDVSEMTERRLRVRVAKNAVDFDLSVGAFDGERMVGFMLVGVGDWLGEPAAFDAGTGIVPGYRGRGLAGRMFDHARPLLEAQRTKRFLLEVLQQNEAAIRAYRKAGFEVTRELSCFRLDVQAARRDRSPGPSFDVRPMPREAVEPFRDHADWLPSWENGFAAIARIPDRLIVLGAHVDGRCTGEVAYSPELNWIMSLIVARGFRRRGIATALVRELVGRLPEGQAGLKLLNVDRSDHGMLSALERLGFAPWVDQYEMVCPI